MIISCIKWFCQIFDEDSVESAVEELFSESDEIFGIMGGIIRYSPPLCNCFPGRIYVYVLKMFQWPQLKAWENIKPIYKSSACTCPTIITITLFHWQSEQAVAFFLILCYPLNERIKHLHFQCLKDLIQKIAVINLIDHKNNSWRSHLNLRCHNNVMLLLWLF